MGFIPGSHRRTGLSIQVIMDPRSLFDQAPELEWTERVQAPLRAGGATFHQGWTAHRAGPNQTEVMRVAFSAIYVDASERVARPVGWLPRPLAVGDAFPDDACPVVCS